MFELLLFVVELLLLEVVALDEVDELLDEVVAVWVVLF